MSDNLYFIPILTKALQKPGVKKALRDAFREIKKKGIQKHFAEGFRNFGLFMDTVCSWHDAVATDHVRELIAELTTGTFEGTEQEKKVLTNIICSRPQWRTEYLTICRLQDNADLRRETMPEIAVISEKRPTGYVSFPKGPGCQRLDNILPGNYKLELTNTGWTIWEGELTAKDLISSETHERENLRLAAGSLPPTNEIDLLGNGDLILRTYAEDESGRIEIELTR